MDLGNCSNFIHALHTYTHKHAHIRVKSPPRVQQFRINKILLCAKQYIYICAHTHKLGLKHEKLKRFSLTATAFSYCKNKITVYGLRLSEKRGINSRMYTTKLPLLQYRKVTLCFRSLKAYI